MNIKFPLFVGIANLPASTNDRDRILGVVVERIPRRVLDISIVLALSRISLTSK